MGAAAAAAAVASDAVATTLGSSSSLFFPAELEELLGEALPLILNQSVSPESFRKVFFCQKFFSFTEYAHRLLLASEKG